MSKIHRLTNAGLINKPHVSGLHISGGAEAEVDGIYLATDITTNKEIGKKAFKQGEPFPERWKGYCVNWQLC